MRRIPFAILFAIVTVAVAIAVAVGAGAVPADPHAVAEHVGLTSGDPDGPEDDPWEIDGYVLDVSTVETWQQTYRERPAVAVRVNGTLRNATVRAVLRGPDGRVVAEDRAGSSSERHVSRVTTAYLPMASDGAPEPGTYTVLVYASPTGEVLHRETRVVEGVAADVTGLNVTTETDTFAYVEGCDDVYARTVTIGFEVTNDGDVGARFDLDVALNDTRRRGTRLLDPGETEPVSVTVEQTPARDGSYRLPSGPRTVSVRVSTHGNRTLDETETTVVLDRPNANRSCRERPPSVRTSRAAMED